MRAITVRRESCRVAVIGDVGAHFDQLIQELVRLGCSFEPFKMPEGLTIVQVGDLIHRGDDSEQLVAFIDQVIHEYSGRWIQLAGNHEALYLQEPQFKWRQEISVEAAETIRSWWWNGLMLASVALHSRSEEVLVTHAGVTKKYWRENLGAPKSARGAAIRINALIGTDEETLFKTGQMLGDGPPNLGAGPLWASAAGELIPSWANSDVPMPFSQVHGHSTVIDWATGSVPDSFAQKSEMTFDAEAAHELMMLRGGRRIIGIDPGHNVAPHLPWRALVLRGYEVASS